MQYDTMHKSINFIDVYRFAVVRTMSNFWVDLSTSVINERSK